MLRIILKILFILTLVFFSASAVQSAQDIYSMDIQELSEVECARCHYPVYLTIKHHGDAHRQPCRDCHEKYHNFRRVLKWEDRVPECQECHQNPHGEEEDMIRCMTCHEDEHAPVYSIRLEKIEDQCGRCHATPPEDLANNQSAHSELSCTDCHMEKHGNIPECIVCHEEPHSEFQTNAKCARCHPPHRPVELMFSSDIPNTACRDCHEESFEMLSRGKLAHSALKCAFCHSEEHGSVPTCQKCHDTPHAKEMVEEFGGCAECHGSPHDLEPMQ